MEKSIALVDFSWVCYKNRFSLAGAGIIDVLPDGTEYIRPTGHLHGTLRDILQLSQDYSLVILAVDSFTKWRREAFPAYKSGRHEPKGDPSLDYNITQDFPILLSLCSSIKNCVFVKKTSPDGFEADDIIASFLYYSRLPPPDSDSLPLIDYHLVLYATDVDLLQVPGRFTWYRNFNEAPTDRVSYLTNKFDLPLDYLPHLYKIVRGDASDKLPPGVPYFPSKLLVPLCLSIDYTNERDILSYSLQDYVDILRNISSGVTQRVKAVISSLNTSDVGSQFSINYKLTRPWVEPVKRSDLLKSVLTGDQVLEVLDRYGLQVFGPQMRVFCGG